MTDPRLVQPQRATPGHPADEEACGHRYWCRTRITAVVLMALLVVGLGVGAWWWTR